MSFLDTILIDGQDVRSVTGWQVVGIIGHQATGDRRGDDDDVPGRDGSLGAILPIAKNIIRVSFRISGATRGERNDNWRNGIALLDGGANGLCSIARRVAKGSSSGYDEHTTDGRYLTGSNLGVMNPYTGQCDLQYYNLRGRWWTGSIWLRH